MFKKILFLIFSALLVPVYAEMESTVSVDSKITKEFMPDTVKIRFFVENSGLNINDIKQKNDKTVNAATSKIKAKLASNESIKTIAYNINNVYSYKDKVKIFQKYEVRNGFEVKLKDTNKISDIIKIATDSGINRVDNLNFYIEDNEKICNELLKEATKTAKVRAQIVAEAAGSSLLKVKSINPYCSLNTPAPRVYYNKAMMAMADGASEESAPQVIESGTITTSASVSMTYYLK
jgi:hypothetical protein